VSASQFHCRCSGGADEVIESNNGSCLLHCVGLLVARSVDASMSALSPLLEGERKQA
jgi:hypothetical protein